METDPDNREDRAQLLQSLTRHLKADDRVRAVWLAGSLGRGDADDLSDIDLWIAGTDDLLVEVIADPRAWVEARCDATLAFSIPTNAAAGGAYVFSLVRCPHGLQQVDWYWAPAASTKRPQWTAIVFERDPIPLAEEPPTLDNQEWQDLITLWCRESLGMAHIAIKGIRRGNPWVAFRHLRMVADCVATAHWVLEHRRAPVHDDHMDAALPAFMPTNRSDQFDLLHRLLTRLDPVVESVAGRDGESLRETRESIRLAIFRQRPSDDGLQPLG